MKTFKQHQEQQRRELLARLGYQQINTKCAWCKTDLSKIVGGFTFSIAHQTKTFCSVICWNRSCTRPNRGRNVPKQSRDPVKAPPLAR